MKIVQTLCAMLAATATVAVVAAAADADAVGATSPPTASGSQYNNIYTQDELKFCGWRIRTPALVRTRKAVHAIGRCCGENLCTGKSHKCIGHGKNEHCWPPKQPGDDASLWSHIYDDAEPRLADDNSFSTTVMKTSWDGGKTWGNFQVLSPKGETGHSCAHGVYDAAGETLIVQWSHFGTNTTRPATHVRQWQMTSTDDGQSWTWPEDISAQIAGCSASADNQMYLSAGSKIQTHTGRMLWPAHSFGGYACVWYSDDGGKTYNTSNILAKANEISVAEVAVKNGRHQILMDGRGSDKAWKPHRTRYWSTDDGAHWGKGQASALLDDAGSGCERALINVEGTLFTSEPQGPGRTKMVLQCSTDNGKTFPKSHVVNGDLSGGYSALLGASDLVKGGLLMLWENDDGNQYAGVIATDWC